MGAVLLIWGPGGSLGFVGDQSSELTAAEHNPVLIAVAYWLGPLVNQPPNS